jgi:hypothetical protein
MCISSYNSVRLELPIATVTQAAARLQTELIRTYFARPGRSDSDLKGH